MELKSCAWHEFETDAAYNRSSSASVSFSVGSGFGSGCGDFVDSGSSALAAALSHAVRVDDSTYGAGGC